VTSLTTGNVDGAVSDFNQSQNYNWLIADFANPVSSFNVNAFNINTTQFAAYNAFNGTFSVARGDTVSGGDDTQLFLLYTAVPEPGTLALVGSSVALVGLGLARRRAAGRA